MIYPVYSMSYGADPELFFEKDGAVIGSERLIEENGLRNAYNIYGPVIVRDGVQFELNPGNGPSAYSLGSQLNRTFQMLREHLKRFPGVKVNFNTLVEVDKAELESLSEKSRIFGCQPSKNIYGEKKVEVDPKVYRKRSAGGHFHFGIEHTNLMDPYQDEDVRHQLVPFFDIFIGNTAVLLDRDPGNIERRQNYGRAGEYRLPRYGIEYRTPSNFWLRSYPLLDLCLGMGKIALGIMSQAIKGDTKARDEIIELVDKNGTIDNFVDAINNNDFNLAMKNMQTLRPFFDHHIPSIGNVFPISAAMFDKFLTFAEGVNTYGLEYFWPKDPVVYWSEDYLMDFQDFLKRM